MNYLRKDGNRLSTKVRSKYFVCLFKKRSKVFREAFMFMDSTPAMNRENDLVLLEVGLLAKCDYPNRQFF